MLIRTTVKVMSGKPGVDTRVVNATTGDVFLFNANRVNGIIVRASSKSSFMFHDRLNDPKEKASYVESEDTVANLVTRADYTFQSSFVNLPLYPDNDTTQSTVATRINNDSIAYVYKDQAYKATKSYLVYQEGGKLRTVRVAYSINQIYSIVDDSNLTTT